MLEVRGLVKIFNRGEVNEKVALNGVDITLAEGDFLTIIGSNGAGKSTLLNVIGGNMGVDGGCIFLAGQDITFLPEFRRAAFIGRVFQDPMRGTAASMTVEENLAIALKRGQKRSFYRGIHKQERELMVENLRLLGLGLENRLNDPVGLYPEASGRR